ncbi:MAG: hypothetical protein ABI588_07315 [Arenimonas sp.]
MSLSTQLARGTLALPMLVLFGALALAADPTAEAQPLSAPPATLVLHAVEAGTCASLPRSTMLLALAPADLGPLVAQRALRASLAASCRA